MGVFVAVMNAFYFHTIPKSCTSSKTCLVLLCKTDKDYEFSILAELILGNSLNSEG